MDYIFTLLADPAAWAALLALITMEVVLGIDNLLFISILTNKLPPERRSFARRLGIGMAVGMRIALLFVIAWIIGLTAPLFSVFGNEISWRDIILIGGGLFLVWKATKEIHHHMEPPEEGDMFESRAAELTVAATIGQILVLDLVFSIDSIVTAVGMTEHVPIMIVAVLVTVSVMLLAADPLGNFIGRHPTVIMLALGFLLLIGVALIADGFGVKIPKGYIYAAMAFSALIEALNLFARRNRKTA
ncbi:membrane protein [Terrihabitans soli]|uniref:Membrane protein n=1 Tax=Terrihabitans soli TaxID=708113 RepID=A0A6S6QJN1_9HYPH|nr:TerC family protein [Terrihabitans soli]BCJ89436.1 membrane protein [Terrihabitans soli]